jgi:hypothetical protein
VRVAGVLVVPGLEGERGVDQVQVHRVQAQPAQARLQRGLHPFGSVIVVPQLGGHEQLVTADGPGSEQLFERRADLCFVAVPLGGVEVAESHLDRGLDGVARLVAVGKRCPEPERRYRTAAVVQDEAFVEVPVRCHVVASLSEL